MTKPFLAAGFIFRELWAHSRRHLVAALLLVIVISLIPALQVRLVANLVDAALVGENATAATLVWLSLVAFLVAISEPAEEILNGVVYRQVSLLRAHLKSNIADRASSFAPHDVRDETSQMRLARVSESVPVSVGFMPRHLFLLLQGVLTAVGLFGAVLSYSAFAAVLILAGLLPVVFASTIFTKHQEAADAELAEIARRSNYEQSLLIDQRPASQLATWGTGWRIARRLRRNALKFADVEGRLLPVIIRMQMIAGIVSGALLAGALAFVVFSQSGAAGALAAGVVGTLSAAGAVRSAGFSFGEIIESTPRVLDLEGFLEDTEPAVVEDETNSETRALEGVLEISNVTFAYPGGRSVLRGVSLKAAPGEMVAIVGKNGAGKTTLVSVAAGLVTGYSGSVCLNGEDLAQKAWSERRRIFGIMPQDAFPFELTVDENLTLATEHDIEPPAKRIDQALEDAEARQFIEGPSRGRRSQLGDQWGGVGLSGGQWQRLALARNIIRDAPIWILDEPTSATDAENEEKIFGHLAKRKAGRIVILVSHRLWTLRHVDRIVVLDEGECVETGTYDELINRRGTFFELFKTQMT